MAIYYVYSGAGGGTGTGVNWGNAFTSLTLAYATEVAGDTIYVAHDHAEVTGAILTLTSSGTLVNPTKVICVDRLGTLPPVAADLRTTAQVKTVGDNSINLQGFTYYYGIIFVAGNGTGAASIGTSLTGWSRYDNCSFRIGSTGAGRIGAGNTTGGYSEWNNTTVSFSGVAQGFDILGILRWRNTASALIGTAVPTTLFAPFAGRGGLVECCGVDLSAAGSGKTLCGTNTQAIAFMYRFLDCKLNASVTKSVVPSGPGMVEIDFSRCGSTGVNYTMFRHRYQGTLDEETTIVRSGGASDGTTPVSWKVVTNASCLALNPFECPPIAIWNTVDGSSVTATIEGVWAGVVVPNNDDIWLDVEYLSDNSTPQSSFVNDGRPDLITTAAAQDSSVVTWGGGTTKFKLAVTFTPQQPGWIYARVKCGKISTTFYIDPKITLS